MIQKYKIYETSRKIHILFKSAYEFFFLGETRKSTSKTSHNPRLLSPRQKISFFSRSKKIGFFLSHNALLAGFPARRSTQMAHLFANHRSRVFFLVFNHFLNLIELIITDLYRKISTHTHTHTLSRSHLIIFNYVHYEKSETIIRKGVI